MGTGGGWKRPCAQPWPETRVRKDIGNKESESSEWEKTWASSQRERDEQDQGGNS